ncbi:hypothetical protein C4K40_4823 [Pseudomonas sp. CMR5c]|nr:hypothetical protein C4K40_4823 [Pseudomonas sp. CMR5c]
MLPWVDLRPLRRVSIILLQPSIADPQLRFMFAGQPWRMRGRSGQALKIPFA